MIKAKHNIIWVKELFSSIKQKQDIKQFGEEFALNMETTEQLKQNSYIIYLPEELVLKSELCYILKENK